VDEPDRLEAVTDGLIALAGDFPVVFPVHPRTRARLEASGGDGRLREAGVHVSPPLGYLDFLGLEADAAFVATDSGGVQEETTFLGVRCFTLRDSNERLVTEELGTNTRLGARPERLVEIPKLLERPKPGEAIPGWDGAAGSRAAKVLRRALG
jgi:UDP-N-acetylglucosamine 2-epimerase (non-hydrolysing)